MLGFPKNERNDYTVRIIIAGGNWIIKIFKYMLKTFELIPKNETNLISEYLYLINSESSMYTLVSKLSWVKVQPDHDKLVTVVVVIVDITPTFETRYTHAPASLRVVL